MTFEVYSINTYDTFSNTYCTNRHETWEVTIEKVFDDKDEAEKYVIVKSKQLPRFKILSENLLDEEKDKFALEFCFGHINNNLTYLKYNRYFIGKPPINKIKKSLRLDGVVIE